MKKLRIIFSLYLLLGVVWSGAGLEAQKGSLGSLVPIPGSSESLADEQIPEDSMGGSTGVADTVQASDTTAVRQIGKRVPQVKGVVSFSNIFWALFLILIGYLFIRLVTKFMNIIAERSARFRIWLKGMIPIFRIIAWTIVIFIIIQGIFKPNWQTILALSASVGVAIGFAAQDILKNIRAEVADVGKVINRRPAGVHICLSGGNRRIVFQ